MIDVEGVVRRFGEVPALRGVDLTVEDGTVVALIGANGAGKTTLVRILATLLVPDCGRAAVGGWEVTGSGDRVRSLIGVAGQYAAVDDRLTGRENLELIGRLYHIGRQERRQRSDELLRRLSLSEAGDRLAGTYSGGMRRRLDIAAGLAGGTPVVILDEPTAGLDPRTRNALWEVIRERSGQGTTVLLTTQYLEEADRLADRIVLIENGRMVADGTPDQLKDLVGSTVLEARVAVPDTERAAALLADLGQRGPRIDPQEQRITIPGIGPQTLPAVSRRLAQARIEVIELGVRRPSLEEVFLALTGPAVMVLLSLHGLPPSQIAELLDCHPATVRRWISRFNSEGLADRSRSGRPRLGRRRLTSRIAALLGRPGPWTLPRIRRCLGWPQVSPRTLYRRVRLVAIWRRPKLTARGDPDHRVTSRISGMPLSRSAHLRLPGLRHHRCATTHRPHDDPLRNHRRHTIGSRQ